ncbi:unnamed protein product [Cylindrotheca closterium]|uniref:GPI inositol-deacylase n=1 Tax=Cylindrotheca closterium TaxID=2856 RepID=A0AAD2GA12_9STRA|nr:unnamed protein product [Cylindrotheca closterium]
MTTTNFAGTSAPSALPSLLISLLLWTTPTTQAWKQCQGGGICPEFATCCPSSVPGSPPACISTRHGKDPLNATGQCCDETTACPYGFACAVRTSDDEIVSLQEQPYCKIDKQNPPTDLFHDQPRYEMCRIPDPSMIIMHGFPIVPHAQEQPNQHDHQNELRGHHHPLKSDTYFQLAYYSSHGDLFQFDGDKIQKVLIMIHGSGRTAEDYFCVALSLVPEGERDSVLVIAPKFLAPVDLNNSTDIKNKNFLIWQEDEAPPKYPMAHSWRYGADALNAPVSSYEAIDRLVEYLTATMNQRQIFPNLKLVTVAGHSAGGQVVHRWALLSKIITSSQQNVEIRTVAANPRSYCYLNGKRMIIYKNKESTNKTRFDYPSAKELEHCPDYDQWNWGLQDGGTLDPVVPYKVRRLKEMTPKELADKYVRQKVFYLTGEYDVIKQKDHCATYELQGKTRHERALHYFGALKAYVKENNGTIADDLNHELHTIPESPHDHLLMFQSAAGREAIFGDIEILTTK